MKISTATYYYKPKISRAERDRLEAELKDKIEEIHGDFPKAGYRMMGKYLARDGLHVNSKKLRRIMGKYGLFSQIKKGFVKTTNSDHDFATHPNLLPEMQVDGVNQVWVADITYIRILTGFVFLAVIMDVFSRRIVGWGISKRLNHQLALDALKSALKKRNPRAGLIHHSDRGVQYACKEYVQLLEDNEILISMSAKGNPYDNAFAESFFKTLKNEEVYLWEYENYLDVLERIPYFIEDVYNKKRLHSGLGYLPPEEFENILKDEERRKGLGQTVLKL